MTSPEPQVDFEIRVYGMRRSGNHAIIQWILAQAEGVTEFFNDASPEAPYAKEPRYGNWKPSAPPANVALSVVSFEDRSFEIIRACESSFQRPRTPRRCIDLLVIRDPFNLFASRLHSPYISAWKTAYLSGLSATQLAERYLEASLSQHFPSRSDRPLLTVNFNQWTENKEYRRSIANALNLEFSDRGIEHLSSFGGGSSFDGKFANPKELDLHSRWEAYAENENYLNKLNRKRLLNLGLEIFPDIHAAFLNRLGTLPDSIERPIEKLVLKFTPGIAAKLRSNAWLVKIHRTFSKGSQRHSITAENRTKRSIPANSSYDNQRSL